jgi:hypothetical protein
MRTSINTLNVALFAFGCSGFAASAMAESRYYDPSNVGGDTTGYELYRTIGCPGKGLLDPGCTAPVVPRPTPAPVVEAAPVAPPVPAPKIPEVLIKSNLPNAKPGECYAKVVTQPEYRIEKVKQMIKPAGERIEVEPAAYETVKEKVLVKEASQSAEVVPAQYDTAEEKVLVRPAYRRAIEVPAIYDNVTEQIMVSPAYTTWKPGTASSIQKIDEKTWLRCPPNTKPSPSRFCVPPRASGMKMCPPSTPPSPRAY